MKKTPEPVSAPSALTPDEQQPPVRGRPGRRSAEDRRRAVLELLSGKATVDQLATRFGVLPQTVEGWRDDALAGIDEALRRGNGKSARELELEREVAALKTAVVDATVKVSMLQQTMGIKPRPTRPARSSR